VQDIVKLLKQPASLVTVFVPANYTCVQVTLHDISGNVDGRNLDVLQNQSTTLVLLIWTNSNKYTVSQNVLPKYK